jgi:hypothetical protein
MDSTEKISGMEDVPFYLMMVGGEKTMAMMMVEC